jgi:glutaredoxin
MNNDPGKCLDIENDEESLACVKRVIAEYTGTCKPKLVLLTQENCPYCEQTKEHRKADLESGAIRQVDVLSTEGREIIKINELGSVPAILLLDCTNRLIE